ncbi:acetyltransferase [Sulfurifustis variabilis]|uniref:Acetyltransferase n=1 Tax=Sulfurifustis variabilis TaxID=1675686 RepID=A0A1B4V6Y3_9GAMM|nr:acetyltransferase [Sulfurifustis variabilis]
MTGALPRSFPACAVPVRRHRDDPDSSLNTRADLPVLKGLVSALHSGVRRYDPSLPPAESIVEAYFRYLLSGIRDTGGRLLLAVDGADEVVGYLCLFGPMPPDEPDERHAYISELYVVPAHRRRGVGRRLVDEAGRPRAGARRVQNRSSTCWRATSRSSGST